LVLTGAAQGRRSQRVPPLHSGPVPGELASHDPLWSLDCDPTHQRARGPARRPGYCRRPRL